MVYPTVHYPQVISKNCPMGYNIQTNLYAAFIPATRFKPKHTSDIKNESAPTAAPIAPFIRFKCQLTSGPTGQISVWKTYAHA